MRTGRSYQEAEVMSSSSEQLVPLIYRELLKNLRRGAEQIANRDYTGKAESMGRASAIVLELLASLDMSHGDLPRQLASLYTYFLKEIEAASGTLDSERLRPTIDMIARLEEAWASAAEQVAQGTPAARERVPTT
jgi:flagellar protein FliS